MAPKMQRPAWAPPREGLRRRPAHASEAEGEEKEKVVVEEYHALASLTMERLKALDIVELGETAYYGVMSRSPDEYRAYDQLRKRWTSS